MSPKIYFLLLVVCLSWSDLFAQVHFPEPDTNSDRQQSHDRQPVASKKCDENEYLYPGDKEGTWVCDCKPGYLYFPKTDKCYRSHSRGPCSNGQQLILPPGKAVPKCLQNSCRNEQHVMFRGLCYPLNSPGPCPQGHAQKQVILVDPATLQLKCGSISLATRFDEDEECYLGSKRAQTGICTPPALVES